MPASVVCEVGWIFYLEAMPLIFLLLAFLLYTAIAQPQPPFTDPRDNKTYRAVKIGEQVWMAENLNYEAEGSKCYDNDPANCAKYGRLYDWKTAMRACPSGWHLPSSDEWMVLYKYLDNNYGTNNYYMDSIVINLLNAKTGWSDGGNGTDKYGFSALPGGGLYSWGLEETFNSHPANIIRRFARGQLRVGGLGKMQMASKNLPIFIGVHGNTYF